MESNQISAFEVDGDSTFAQINMGVRDSSESALSARKPSGGPVYGSAIRQDSIVLVDGIETSVKNAERLGYIVRDSSGLYRRVHVDEHATTAAGSEEVDAESQASYVVELPADAKAILTDLQGMAQPSDLLRACGEVIDAGGVSDQTLIALASSRGVDPDELRGELGKVQAAFTEQGLAALSEASGLPGEFASGILQEIAPRELKAAARSFFVSGDTAALRELAFKATSHHLTEIESGRSKTAIEAVADSGLTISKNGRTILVSGEGVPEMTLKQAFRLGLVQIQGDAA